ncbi:hypothetical protein CMO94_04175 [Candidatus Woesearchaeota archaeon]|jgi:hypothetical protein|nr:hypothetical protein [Candidatus Woesearchaeota archaeon]
MEKSIIYRPQERMDDFSQQALSIADEVLLKYDPIKAMSIMNYDALKNGVVDSIERRILGKNDNDTSVPLNPAMDIFDRMMYSAALEYAREQGLNGVINRAAESLGYDRSHFSRKAKQLGVDTEVFKFREKLIGRILGEQANNYKTSLPAGEFDKLQSLIPDIGEELSDKLNQLRMYEFYVNRTSFVYKIAEDVLKERYDEVKGTKEAYRNLQDEFKQRYLRKLLEEAVSLQDLAQTARVSQRTVSRAVGPGIA